jgi:hypothetical protein
MALLDHATPKEATMTTILITSRVLPIGFLSQQHPA